MSLATAVPALLDDEVVRDPQSLYRVLRAEAPVHYDESVDAWLVTTFEGVQTVYKDPRFSTRAYEDTIEAMHGRTVLSMDGLVHAKNRALLTPHFRGHGLESVHGLIHGVASRIIFDVVQGSVPSRAQELADDLERSANGPVDLVARFAHRYPIAVIADMLGLPEEDQDRFAAWYGAIMDYVSNLAQDPVIHEAGQLARAELTEYMMPLIAQRRAEPGADLISALVTSSVDDFAMTDEEVRSYVSLLLVAGGETTDKAMGSIVKNLLLAGDWGRVRDDRSLVLNALAETMRFSPPSQITMRWAEEAVELHGATVPAGSKVLLVAASGNRDERRFRDVDRFLLERDDLDPRKAFSGNAGHLGFGAGRHFCLGAMLARTEMEVGLNLLLDRFPDLRLAPGAEPVDVGLKTRGPQDLMVDLG